MDRWRFEDGRSWYFWFVIVCAIALGAYVMGAIVAPAAIHAGNDVYHSITSTIQNMKQSIGL